MFIRKCPKCSKELSYKTKGSFRRSEINNMSCLSCSRKGSNFRNGIKHSEETKLKMSESAKGNKNSFNYVWSKEQRTNLSLSKGGDGQLEKFSKSRLHKWSQSAREKTPFCEWCYSEDNLEAHHIMPKSKFPQYAYDLDNARVMCYDCHKICHKQGGY